MNKYMLIILLRLYAWLKTSVHAWPEDTTGPEFVGHYGSWRPKNSIVSVIYFPRIAWKFMKLIQTQNICYSKTISQPLDCKPKIATN